MLEFIKFFPTPGFASFPVLFFVQFSPRRPSGLLCSAQRCWCDDTARDCVCRTAVERLAALTHSLTEINFPSYHSSHYAPRTWGSLITVNYGCGMIFIIYLFHKHERVPSITHRKAFGASFTVRYWSEKELRERTNNHSTTRKKTTQTNSATKQTHSAPYWGIALQLTDFR